MPRRSSRKATGVEHTGGDGELKGRRGEVPGRRRRRLEEGALGGHPPDGLHEVGELQDLGQLEAPLGLRRRPLLLRLAPRLGDVVLRLLQRLGTLLVKLPLRNNTGRSMCE